LTVPWSTFSVDVVAGDAVLYFLEIFKKYKIIEYRRMFTLSDGSNIYISGTEVNGFPALEMNSVAVAEDSELTNVTVDWLSCHGGENCSQECQ